MSINASILRELASLLHSQGSVDDIVAAISEKDIPPELARRFVCDVARRYKNRALQGGMHINDFSSHALDMAERYIVGRCSREDLVATRNNMGVRGIRHSKDYFKYTGDLFDSAHLIGLRHCHMDAAYLAERACLVDAYSGAMAPFHSERRFCKIDEPWLFARMAYLCDVWAACGERAAWLLYEGKCPLGVPEEARL